jgi:hypothetical protein
MVCACRYTRVSSQFHQVLDARRNSSNALVIERAPFPALRHGVGIGAQLVWLQSSQMLAFALQHADVRTEKLVG